jgi:hypothetical protein
MNYIKVLPEARDKNFHGTHSERALKRGHDVLCKEYLKNK